MKLPSSLGLAAVLSATATLSFAAPPPAAFDVPPSNVVASPPVDMTQTAPAPTQVEKPRQLSGNPLWAIPLSTLSATRERPLFSPSRRPAAPPAVAGPPRAEAVAAAPPPAGPERPQLILVGAVVGNSGGIAIFLDQTTNDIVRLKTGDSHLGWTLRSVQGREATLQNERMTTTLALPAPGEASTAPVPSAPPVPGAPPAAPRAGSDASLPPGYSRTPSGEIVNTE
jgi:general secretion pathway protein N